MYTKSDIEDRIVESFADSTIKTVATDWITCDLMGSDCEAGQQAKNIILEIIACALSGEKPNINPQQYSAIQDYVNQKAAEYAKSDFPMLKQEAVNGWEDSLENVA